MMKLRRAQAGDTLVEVLLATVVISMVLAGAFTISNRALRINQNAQERTEVANKMREQAEILRSLAISQNTQAWTDLVNGTNGGQGVYFDFLGDPTDPLSGAVNDPTSSGYVQNFDFSAPLPEDTYGVRGVVDIFDIWIERTEQVTGQYMTFVIKAEWDGIGDLGQQRSGLSIRVEDKN